jgi:hypothetical protein
VSPTPSRFPDIPNNDSLPAQQGWVMRRIGVFERSGGTVAGDGVPAGEAIQMSDYLMRALAALPFLLLLALFWPFEFGASWRPGVLLATVSAQVLLLLLWALHEAVIYVRRRISEGRPPAQ